MMETSPAFPHAIAPFYVAASGFNEYTQEFEHLF
jgi:hypothetical protein